MPIIASVFFGFAPMFLFAVFVYWLDRYEKEPKPLLTTVFFWGVIIAAGGAFVINTVLGAGIYFLTGSELTTNVSTGSFIAPVVEETLKGLAVLIVFLIFRREFDSILDGIIYAAVVALGFAATENSLYIYNGYRDGGWSALWALVFIRVVLVGVQHPFYTAFIGIGLAFARLNRRASVWLIAPLVGWTLAVLAHSFHNSVRVIFGGGLGLLAGTALDWTGWVAMAAFTAWALWRESVCLRTQLKDEVELGLLTPRQYRTAGSALAQFSAGTAALMNGNYPSTVRFYQTCGELAHKKEQLAALGDEGGNRLIIERLRAELTELSTRVRA
jgi:RsiW-degrading membrane proteinase PrsW (M82 family)